MTDEKIKQFLQKDFNNFVDRINKQKTLKPDLQIAEINKNIIPNNHTNEIRNSNANNVINNNNTVITAPSNHTYRQLEKSIQSLPNNKENEDNQPITRYNNKRKPVYDLENVLYFNPLTQQLESPYKRPRTNKFNLDKLKVTDYTKDYFSEQRKR